MINKKILIITFGIILLAGLVVSFVQITYTINFNTNDRVTLQNIGIGKIEIRNQSCIQWNGINCIQIDNTFLGYDEPVISSCVKQDEFTCKSNIYQKDGINKQIEIETKYCETYNSVGLDEITCSSWKTLTQAEIETEMQNEVEAILLGIAEVQTNRNKNKEILTNEILITINEK